MHVIDIFIVFHIYEMTVLANIAKRKCSQIKGGLQKSNCLSKKDLSGPKLLILFVIFQFWLC